MTSRAPLHPTRRLLLLALIVVVTQMLALMHGVIHAAPDSVRGHHETGEAHLDDVRGAHSETEAHSGSGWLTALFSAHEGQSDCRLYDQVSRDALTAGPVITGLHAAPVGLIVSIPRGEALARWAALFEARGPPLL